MSARFDLVVVGAGIVGLAHALVAVRRGLSVAVVDREAELVGASVRNFGLVAVTGQEPLACWGRAMRSREVWLEVAAEAGIDVVQRGLLVVAQRAEAMAVLAAYRATEMGAECELLGPEAARRRSADALGRRPFLGALWSPHELRVDSRLALPRLARWLEATHPVRFFRRVAVRDVSSGRVETTAGTLLAARVVVCPGDDLVTLFPERLAALGIERCSLQMLRVAPEALAFRLPAVVMSDLSLVRYQGYARLPEAAALQARLQAEQAAHLARGVHLIVTQDADGTLTVGDSHRYGWSPCPYADEAVDALILGELQAVLGLPEARVVERWVGVHASLGGVAMVRDAPAPGVGLVVVTSGTGASTAFAIAEETLNELG